MRTRFSALVTPAILAVCLAALPVAAQDPSATPARPPDPGTPVAVPYIDSAGVDHGTVTVRSIEDPFAGFDPGAPPAEGQRYVLLTVVFEAAMDQSFWADPNAVVLQDTSGFLRGPVGVPRAQPVTVPDFQSQTLGPGDRVSGAIGYIVPADASLSSVLYVPERNRYVPLQSASSEPGPAVGEPVTAYDAAGVVHGTVTVRELAAPYMAFDPASPPPEGTRYVLVSIVFEAADDQALWADPYGVLLQDANGYLLTFSGIRRPVEDVVPDLQSQTLAPGDRVSGDVGYTVPVNTTITSVQWSPEGGRLVPLVDVPG